MSFYGLVRTVKPAEEPITLTQAKLYARVDETAEDSVVTDLIEAARVYCELFQHRVYVTQTWTLVLDDFPRDIIEIPLPPLQSITSIVYNDSDGASQTVTASDYVVNTSSSQGGRVTLARDASWPSVFGESGDVVVTFVAGYGGASDVPATVRQAMKLWLNLHFEERQPVVIAATVVNLKFSLESLLTIDRVTRLC